MRKLLLVFSLLALAAPRVDAAISVVETQEVHTASATSSLATNAFSANPATGDLIVCLVSTVKFSGEAPAHNACTDTAANAYTQIGTTLQFTLSWGAGLSLSMWRAENIIGDANFQVTAHAAADIDVMTVRAYHVTGQAVNSYNGDVISASGMGFRAAPGTTNPAPTPDSLFIGFMSFDGSVGVGDPSGWTAADFSDNINYFGQYTESVISSDAQNSQWAWTDEEDSWGAIVASFRPAASLEWVARYHGQASGYDVASAMAVDGLGNVYVTGQSLSGMTGANYGTVAYDASGVQLWEARYTGPENTDGASAIALDGFGHVYVTGASFGGVETGFDYATVAYDAATGTQLWAARYNGPGIAYPFNADMATAIAVDSLGHVYVTGRSDGDTTGRDYATVAYDAMTGAQLWVARYNGSGNSDDLATGIAVDGLGHVCVTGSSRNGMRDGDYAYATVAYDPLTGTQVWEARYNGPLSLYNIAGAIAVDNLAHVYVTGYSWGGATNYDYATVAYDAMTGTQLWETRYNGPGNTADAATAIAVDGRGHVFVTGESDPSDQYEYDYATVAYDALTGTQLWEARYDGFGNGSNSAYAIAVDYLGNVYVTGSSFGDVTTFYDTATVAYDPSGALLWVGRYNGPGNGYDDGAAIAVDRFGNVYVTGSSDRGGGNGDYATLKYSHR